MSGLAARVLVPGFVTTLRGYLRYRALISPRSEVELTEQLEIGPGTRIGSFCKIKSSDGPLRLGARVDIGAGCFLSPGEGGIEIGDDALVSPNVSIVARNYRYEDLDRTFREQGHTSAGIRIGPNVWIGAGAAILDGAVIGAGAIVTPNSVVSGEVAAGAIVQGNPAKVVFVRR